MNQKKPNFIVIGAMKAATTSLYTYLRQHPQVFMPEKKELMFFNNYKQDNDYKFLGRKRVFNKDLDTYLDYFSQADNEIAIGEASPAYIYNKKAPELIKETLPQVKLIAILRHPVDRAYSNFLHVRKSGRETEDNFQSAIDLEKIRIKEGWSPLYHYLEKGYYSSQIERYLSVFSREEIKIILFEDLIKDTRNTLGDIFDFIGVSQDVEINISKISNISGSPNGFLGWVAKKMRYYNLTPNLSLSKYLPVSLVTCISRLIYKDVEKLDVSLRKEIIEKYYTSEIIQLEKLINRDLSHWRS